MTSDCFIVLVLLLSVIVSSVFSSVEAIVVVPITSFSSPKSAQRMKAAVATATTAAISETKTNQDNMAMAQQEHLQRGWSERDFQVMKEICHTSSLRHEHQ